MSGIGVADVNKQRPATAETLFRIGSTSKAFVSMAILMLVDQGRLSLNDPVKKIVPEVWFDNKWEASDPIRVVHLLEHTTGWDDMHLREYAKDAKEMSLKEGLDYDHHSRTSRWPPGTRFAYCNSGPAVAAYIVEKLTGQRFEEFVEHNLFLPIGMTTATYFQPADTRMTTVQYHNDGKTPFPYWNILMRPAGAINALANDMAAYLQFYLNRGTVNGATVMSNANLNRMENPQSSWAAKEGLHAGYGLSNYWAVYDGFTYHGHNGGIPGGLTDMSYMPEYGVGYFYSINSGNDKTYKRIGMAIRAYITRDQPKPVVPKPGVISADSPMYSGWYEPDSPRMQMVYFAGRIVGLTRVNFVNGKMVISNMAGAHPLLS